MFGLICQFVESGYFESVISSLDKVLNLHPLDFISPYITLTIWASYIIIKHINEDTWEEIHFYITLFWFLKEFMVPSEQLKLFSNEDIVGIHYDTEDKGKF